jgi:hypothetical protein
MRRARTDANQAGIVRALERAGCLVHSTHREGGGFPDLVVSRASRVYLIEVKTATGRLRAAQERFRALGWPVSIARDENEALAIVGLVT